MDFVSCLWLDIYFCGWLDFVHGGLDPGVDLMNVLNKVPPWSLIDCWFGADLCVWCVSVVSGCIMCQHDLSHHCGC